MHLYSSPYSRAGLVLGVVLIVVARSWLERRAGGAKLGVLIGKRVRADKCGNCGEFVGGAPCPACEREIYRPEQDVSQVWPRYLLAWAILSTFLCVGYMYDPGFSNPMLGSAAIAIWSFTVALIFVVLIRAETMKA